MSRAFEASIKKCIDLLYEIDFLYQVGTGQSLSASNDFKRVSRRSLSYREVYDTGSKMQDFNLMLVDKSYFQFTEEKEGEEIRLAYYPNPYKFVEYQDHKREALNLLDNREISEDEYDQLISEEFTTTDVPVIRYDLSLRQYCENYHPAAHLHIGFFSNNRWPVRRKLSPLAFLFKILMHYYPTLWFRIGDSGDPEKPNNLDVQYRAEVITCPFLDSNFFSKIECERIYLN